MNILSYFFARVMTATLLFAAVTMAGAEPVFKFAEWKTTTALTLPQTDDGTDGAVSGNAGLRLSFAHVDARWYLTLPKTAMERLAIADTPTALYELCGKPRYGVAASFGGKGRPALTVRAGTVSYARSVAQLKSPSPATTANPLVQSFGASSGLGAALPTLTSSEQPLSVAFLLALPTQHRLTATLEAATSDNGTLLASVQTKAQLTRHSAVHAALTAGRFRLKSTTTLARAGADFASDWYAAAVAEAGFTGAACKAQLRAALHQSPYGGNALWVQGAIRTGWQCLLLNVSAFAVPLYAESPQAAPLIGASSAVCRTHWQVGVNPQLALPLTDRGATLLRLGVHALVQQRVTATKYADSYQTLKLTTGARIENSRHTFKATCAAVNVGMHGEFHTAGAIPDRHYDAAVSYTLSLPTVRASLSADAKHYPAELLKTSAKEQTVYTLRATANPGRERRLAVQASGSATCTDGVRTAGSIDAAATARLGTRQLRTVLKCAITLPF